MKKISHLLVLTAICTITAAMAPAGAAYAQNAPYWRADWEEGPCTGASCYTDWSFVQAENPAEADPALNAIVSGLVSTGAGNVSSHGGNSFGKFETTLAAINAGKPHSKVYKEWLFAGGLAKNDAFGRPLQAVPPSGIDGTYVAWFFIPSDYQYAGNGWTNIFQFKVTEQSPFKQDPTWWVNLTDNPTDDVVMLHVENAAAGVHNPANDVPAPKGRWFQLRADLYEGVGIDWYLDGVFWQSSSNATWPVGRDSDGSGTPQSFVFGVGHYGGVGKLYTDDAYMIAK
ncbi:hypothetical protein NKJ09_19225 [Mesorhizobium sp. M0189]|uniref:hypothetical protein n=1 Tax=unclassified Mesorhizobium TaxID=325217 RepID=UPI0033379684